MARVAPPMKTTFASGEPQVITEPVEIDGPRRLLEEIIAQEAGVRANRLELPSGRVIEAGAEGGGEERLTVRSATGVVELEVRLTERGPVLRFRAAELELAASGEVRVDCDRFQVRATSGIVQETAGDLTLAGRSARIE